MDFIFCTLGEYRHGDGTYIEEDDDSVSIGAMEVSEVSEDAGDADHEGDEDVGQGQRSRSGAAGVGARQGTLQRQSSFHHIPSQAGDHSTQSHHQGAAVHSQYHTQPQHVPSGGQYQQHYRGAPSDAHYQHQGVPVPPQNRGPPPSPRGAPPQAVPPTHRYPPPHQQQQGGKHYQPRPPPRQPPYPAHAVVSHMLNLLSMLISNIFLQLVLTIPSFDFRHPDNEHLNEYQYV